MTDVEIDLAGSDIYDTIKTFLDYCTDGSVQSATESAMDYVKAKYTMNSFEYRKLSALARTSYNDITKTTLASLRKPQGNKR